MIAKPDADNQIRSIARMPFQAQTKRLEMIQIVDFIFHPDGRMGITATNHVAFMPCGIAFTQGKMHFPAACQGAQRGIRKRGKMAYIGRHEGW